VALSSLMTLLTLVRRTHVACSGHLIRPFPTIQLAHTPAGCGHGGTRYSTTSPRLSGNFPASLLSFQAAFWRYWKAGLGRGESLLSIRLILLIWIMVVLATGLRS